MKIKDRYNYKTCKKCGGNCCLLYLHVRDGGARPINTWFEEWAEDWTEEFEICGALTSGVKQLFNPLEVHLKGNEHMKEALIARGINPNACQYLGKNGCLLPREKRPKSCREYVCKKLDKALEN